MEMQLKLISLFCVWDIKTTKIESVLKNGTNRNE